MQTRLDNFVVGNPDERGRLVTDGGIIATQPGDDTPSHEFSDVEHDTECVTCGGDGVREIAADGSVIPCFVGMKAEWNHQ